MASLTHGLGSALGGLFKVPSAAEYDAAYQQQSAQFNNAYGQWISMRNVAVCANGIRLRGEDLSQDEVECDLTTYRVHKKSEFRWLRDRVNEICWKPS